MTSEVTVLIIGGLFTVAGALGGHWFGRRRTEAEAEEIIGKAWNQVVTGQAGHIDLMRTELKLACDEIHSLRTEINQVREAHAQCETRLGAMASEISEIKAMVQP